MARAIDANELMVEIQVCSWDSEQDKERAEDLVLGMPTLTPPNEPLTGWVSVEERLPELQGKDRCSKMVIACDKNGHVAPMIWERAQIRGKKIERWKYYWDRIYDGAGITHWRPLPAPPYRRPPEGEEET